MDATDVAKVAAQGALAFGALVAATVTLSSLTRGERLRRRIKTHVEILKELPAGPQADMIRRLIDRDIEALHALAFPSPNQLLDRANLTEARAAGAAAVLSLGVALTQSRGGDLNVDSFLLISVTIFTALGAIGAIADRRRRRRNHLEDSEN